MIPRRCFHVTNKLLYTCKVKFQYATGEICDWMEHSFELPNVPQQAISFGLERQHFNPLLTRCIGLHAF